MTLYYCIMLTCFIDTYNYLVLITRDPGVLPRSPNYLKLRQKKDEQVAMS